VVALLDSQPELHVAEELIGEDIPVFHTDFLLQTLIPA
jgi:hypothetical protein